MVKINLFKKLALSAVIVALSGQAAIADNLRLTPGLPPAHPGYTPLFTSFQEQLGELTKGGLTGTLLGTEVANIGNMRNAIKSGLSDAGMFLPAYFPADLPELNLVGNLSFLGTNSQAMGAAMTEYVVTCGDCQAELDKLGVVYTSSHASDLYQLLTTKPVRTLKDLEGVRLRAGGPQYSRWADAMGAVGSNTSVGEQFEAISQGVLDGSIASTADLTSFRLDDVVGYVTTLKMGTYHNSISHAVRQQTWGKLSLEERKALMQASVYASAQATQRWAREMPAEAEAAAKAKGIEFIEPSDELIQATRDFAEADLQIVIRNNEERFGISKVADKIERFQQLVDKWNAYAESVDNDPALMAEEINRQVWSQVDLNTYGL